MDCFVAIRSIVIRWLSPSIEISTLFRRGGISSVYGCSILVRSDDKIPFSLAGSELDLGRFSGSFDSLASRGPWSQALPLKAAVGWRRQVTRDPILSTSGRLIRTVKEYPCPGFTRHMTGYRRMVTRTWGIGSSRQREPLVGS